MGESGSGPKLAAEFIGTYLLVFTVGCVVLTSPPVWGGVAIAAVLTVLIYALSKCSGAHLNPAVSLAIGISGQLGLKSAPSWGELGGFIGAQIAGGLLGGLTYAMTFWTAFNLEPTPGHGLFAACCCEALYTFMLCFVVLNTCCVGDEMTNKGIEYQGLAIGFVVVAGAYGAGAVSMGCFNPAVAIGIDISSAFLGFKYSLIYFFFEAIGAAMAAVMFRLVRPGEFNADPVVPQEIPTYSKLTSEFLGTFMLVLTVGLNVLNNSPAGAFSIACSLMCMIYALGGVSGAHFNPAVTAAVMGRQSADFPPNQGPVYMAVQILAGIVAALTYCGIMGGMTFGLKPPGYGWHQVIIAEFVFTFVLCFVVLSVATVKDGYKNFFGFAIGMCVTAGGYAIGKVSGGSLNPAVTFGITISHMLNGGPFTPALVYSITELLAGLAAAAAFRVCNPSEFQKKSRPVEGYNSTA